MFSLPLYIDPGTGSIIIQLIIATIIGGLVAIKMFWQKIVHFFTRFLKK